MSWQSCNEDEISKKIKIVKDIPIASITSSAEWRFNNVETNYLNKNDGDEEEKSSNQEDRKEITKDYLLKMLANFGRSSLSNSESKKIVNKATNQKLNVTYLTINEANLNLKSQHVIFHEDLSHRPEDATLEEKSHNETMNVIADSEEKQLESYKDPNNNEYAFIIVPVKVPNREKQISNARKAKTEVLPSTQNEDDRNLKSFQSKKS